MKQIRLLAIGALVAGLMFFGLGQALADVTINVPTTFASVAVKGVFTVTGNLTITGTGSITCNDSPGLPSGASGCPIKIVVHGNFLMDAGSKIQAENNYNGGSGGDIEITVDGDATLEGTTLPPNPIKGAIISSSKTAGAGDTGHSGNITLDVAGNVTQEAGSRIQAGSSAGASGTGGTISISGRYISIDGLVSSWGGSTVGKGGPITIKSDCDLTVGDTGSVSSKGLDPGADRVHLEGGCTVQIYGLVESTGPGHQRPSNLCNSAPGILDPRPDKPSNSTACVEVWAGNSLEINSISPHDGEVNADTGMSGGNSGRGWIDLFARGDITIKGSSTGSWVVHAIQSVTNGYGGLIEVKSTEGNVVATGRAIQANSQGGGGKGGNVLVDATLNVDLIGGKIEAKGTTTGGYPAGGTIDVQSFNGSILSDGNSVLDVTGNKTPNGIVKLIACGAIGFGFPPGNPGMVIPAGASLTTTTPLCGGAPTLPGYVTLPDCVCGGAGISVTKECSDGFDFTDPGAQDIPITFWGTVTNNTVDLMTSVTVGDDHAVNTIWTSGPASGQPTSTAIQLDPGASADYSGSYLVYPSGFYYTNTVTATSNTATATASAECLMGGE